MTRSKVELATILVKLKGDITDEKKIEKEVKKIANEMSLMKLCYEIQKVEEEREAPPPEAPKDEAPELTKDEQKVVEELKVSEKVSKEKRHKHILSWLLDSSSDEEA
jgi:HD superfamily phosphodiesterase